MTRILEQLRGGLVVSCQPVPGGPMDQPQTVAAFALAALAGGAVGLRIEGLANVRAVRAVTDAPIIGLVKRDLDDSAIRITPFLQDVAGLAEAGADVIAFDATDRPRPLPCADIVAAIHAAGRIAMADCSSEAEGHAARALGCEILGSTMSGYTGGDVPDAPDLHLVTALSRMGAFVIAEGRYHAPEQAAAAIAHGADAVVVGSAITRTEHVTEWFARAIATARPANSKAVLSIDLGGSKIIVALVQGKTVHDRAELPTDRSGGPDDWLHAIAKIAQGWKGRFDRAGMTVTGLVSGGIWRALNPATLNLLDDFPLRARLTALLNVPVALANDAQAAAWGEHVYGAGAGSDIVFMTVSTGIGGGVVSDGRLLQGRSGLAGHFGQLLPPDGALTLLEDAASGTWIARRAAAIGLAQDARAVFAAAEAGDARAAEILSTSAVRVGRLCENLQLSFDPDRIVIGGGVGLGPGYLDRVARSLAHLDDLRRPQLVPAQLGRDAGIIGMADLALGNQNNREKTL
jgi:N-acetylmannosamine-6-phosphate 2-epimerase / N-acetylmannosamine kinase